MRPVRLPVENYYVSVDHAVLEIAMAGIEERFRDLLLAGRQAAGLPEGAYAAGQYLNPHTLNQRGLYGTSAALLVFSRSAAKPDRLTFIEGIVRYLGNRPAIEEGLASSDSEHSALAARLAIEWRTSFKCADLLYALAAAPAVTSGREDLIKRVMARIEQGRRPDGGWAADLDPTREADPLATASIVRALNAAGPYNSDVDVALVRRSALDPVNRADVRVFCLLTLLELGQADAELDGLWKRLTRELAPRSRERREGQHRFALANHHHYVGVPGQLYLLACAALRNPLAIHVNRRVRLIALDALTALNSTEGYVFDGSMKSTRTYGILMDTLWRIDHTLTRSSYMGPLSALANLVVRFFYSRSLMWLSLAGAVALAAVSVWSWLRDDGAPLGAVGSELVAAALLGALGLLVRRVRG